MLNEKKHRNSIKAISFFIILCLLCMGLGRFFIPHFSLESNFYGKKAFNEQPVNSIETVLIGSSVIYHGLSPMEMYEAHGISVWDLGSSYQPTSASYYLLQEAYRLHSETLKTVVFDPFELTRETNTYMRRLIMDAMKYYDLKFKANIGFTDTITDAAVYTFPLISYHNRWSEISREDFNKDRDYRPYLRGYYLDTEKSHFDKYEYSELEVPDYTADPEKEEAHFDKEALVYFKKIIDFCMEKDLKLVIIKTPMSMHWGDSEHNAMVKIADDYGLEFYDFNYDPLFTDIGFNYATDLKDTDHMNYYGVRKLTAWLGDYLVNECSAADVRGMDGYEHLEKELTEYQKRVKDLVALRAENDPAKYLSRALAHDDYTVFISAKDDAASYLTQEQRITFSDLGLPALSVLGSMDSYLAVIDPVCGILYEDTEKDPGEGEEGEPEVDNLAVMEQTGVEDLRQSRQSIQSDESEQEQDENDRLLEFEGNLSDGGYYVIKSGGENLGGKASCIINDIEYAADGDGLNIILYDNSTGEVVDNTVFNTSVSPTRLGNDLEAELKTVMDNNVNYDDMPLPLQKLILYNTRCEKARSAGPVDAEEDDE